jgi:hypothetical protein
LDKVININKVLTLLLEIPKSKWREGEEGRREGKVKEKGGRREGEGREKGGRREGEGREKGGRRGASV